MSFGDAIRSGFDNYTNFEGRASRSAFWWWALFTWLVGLVLFILIIALKNIGLVLAIVVWLGLLLPSLAVAVRRLHDTDKSGWWLLIDFVPFGGIVLLIFFILEGTPGPNRHGAPVTAGPPAPGAPPAAA